ncbi:hypothetical protein J2W76_000894 [Methylorubrum zatmanii]|nr:hypothetical protein [Methylorubrum zatmanii]MCP1555735.1 hypothetical protein [Methylorubrum extorquens]MCP1577952.1 hypothetical protein [Methylorubrum extorquens]
MHCRCHETSGGLPDQTALHTGRAAFTEPLKGDVTDPAPGRRAGP